MSDTANLLLLLLISCIYLITRSLRCVCGARLGLKPSCRATYANTASMTSPQIRYPTKLYTYTRQIICKMYGRACSLCAWRATERVMFTSYARVMGLSHTLVMSLPWPRLYWSCLSPIPDWRIYQSCLSPRCD